MIKNAFSDIPFTFFQVDRLKAELMYERRTCEEQLSRFEDERTVWQEEKEKVNKDFCLVDLIFMPVISSIYIAPSYFLIGCT